MRASKLAAAKHLATAPPPLTIRQWCAVFGITIFGAAVLGAAPVHHWSALRAFRDVAKCGAIAGWTAIFGSLDPSALADLLAWLDELTHAPPTPIDRQPAHDTDLELIIDASAFGVGVVSSSFGVDGTVRRMYSLPWSAAERAALQERRYASSSTEPCGAVRAALCCITPTTRALRIVTNHMGLVYAGNAGYGKAWAYNEAVRRLRVLFPAVHFVFAFVPGRLNVADRLSRGLECGDTACDDSILWPSVRIG